MWPWEHLALGYLCYSLAVHLVHRRRPEGRAVLVLAVATQVPDLVDKPLAWTLDVVPVGYAAGHSILVVGPALLAALLFSVARDRPDTGLVVAYGVGHLSHLLGDLVYPLLLGRGVELDRLLWPVASLDPAPESGGLLENVHRYALRYVHQVLTHDVGGLFLVQVGLVCGVVVLWLADGAPGPRTVWRGALR